VRHINKVALEKYGDENSFLLKFSPAKQLEICNNMELCFFGDFPTLSELNQVYYDGMTVEWLMPQLTNLSEYCGCKDKLTISQLHQCAFVIASEFYWLKVSEIMLFCHFFKSAKYGRFYGSVDPLVITSALRMFINDRDNAYFKREMKMNEQKRLQEKNGCITWDEYCKLKEMNKPNPLNIQKLIQS